MATKRAFEPCVTYRPVSLGDGTDQPSGTEAPQQPGMTTGMVPGWAASAEIAGTDDAAELDDELTEAVGDV